MRKPATFTKKPVDIEAMQYWSWSDALTIFRWGAPVFYVPEGAEHDARRDNEKDRSRGDVLETAPAFLIVKTLEGDMRADEGDYIIKGIQGEFYPCKPDIFKETYDEKAVEMHPMPERDFPIGA